MIRFFLQNIKERPAAYFAILILLGYPSDFQTQRSNDKFQIISNQKTNFFSEFWMTNLCFLVDWNSKLNSWRQEYYSKTKIQRKKNFKSDNKFLSKFWMINLCFLIDWNLKLNSWRQECNSKSKVQRKMSNYHFKSEKKQFFYEFWMTNVCFLVDWNLKLNSWRQKLVFFTVVPNRIWLYWVEEKRYKNKVPRKKYNGQFMNNRMMFSHLTQNHKFYTATKFHHEHTFDQNSIVLFLIFPVNAN